jgi:hypothetical protein
MADMSKKHHTLIQDALVEGVLAVFDDCRLIRKLPNVQDRRFVASVLSRILAEGMAEKLRYTHDQFDLNTASSFCGDVQRRVEQGIDTKIKALSPT